MSGRHMCRCRIMARHQKWTVAPPTADKSKLLHDNAKMHKVCRLLMTKLHSLYFNDICPSQVVKRVHGWNEGIFTNCQCVV